MSVAKVTLVGDRMKLRFKGPCLPQTQSPFGDTQVLCQRLVSWGHFRLEGKSAHVNKYSGFDANCLLSLLGPG